jgi:hypothetical protein
MHPVVAAHAVLAGPALVIVAANATMLALAGRQLIGLPAREAFPEPHYLPILQLIEFAFRHGMPMTVGVPAPDGREGLLTIRPSLERVRVVWEPLPVPSSPARVARVPVA